MSETLICENCGKEFKDQDELDIHAADCKAELAE